MPLSTSSACTWTTRVPAVMFSGSSTRYSLSTKTGGLSFWSTMNTVTLTIAERFVEGPSSCAKICCAMENKMELDSRLNNYRAMMQRDFLLTWNDSDVNSSKSSMWLSRTLMMKVAFRSATFGDISNVPLLLSNVSENTPFLPASSSLTRVIYGSGNTNVVPVGEFSLIRAT